MKEKKLDSSRGGEWTSYTTITSETNGCKYEHTCCWSCESCSALSASLSSEGGDDDGGVAADSGSGSVGSVTGGGGSSGSSGILANFISKTSCKERSDNV